MKKRNKWIITIFVIIIIIGIVFAFYFFKRDRFGSESNASVTDFKISFNVRIKALFSGGYSGLYDRLLRKGFDGREALNYISDGLGDKRYNEAEEEKVMPESAHFEFTGDYDKPFVYYEGVVGKMANLSKYYEETAKNLDDKNYEVVMEITEYKPEISIEDLQNLTAKRGEFSSNYSSSPFERKNNIKVAAEYLNGSIMEPMTSLSSCQYHLTRRNGARIRRRSMSALLHRIQCLPDFGTSG